MRGVSPGCDRWRRIILGFGNVRAHGKDRGSTDMANIRAGASGTVNGTGDSDQFIAGFGDHNFVGNGGYDIVAYWESIGPVGVDLNTGRTLTGYNGFGGTDTFQNISGVFGSAFDDYLTGNSFGFTTFAGLDGNDVITGFGSGNTVGYSGNRADYSVTEVGGGNFIIQDNRGSRPDHSTDGRDTVTGIELFQFADGTYTAGNLVSGAPNNPPPPPQAPKFSVFTDGSVQQVDATAYSGPVAGLQWQFLGSSKGEVVGASDGNDFLNLLGGDDAADGRGGNDVLDGGLGSNFLTGGGGRDVFFLDGRAPGTTTWSTITDWEQGEQLSLFGWRPGVSTLSWIARDGTPGFQGVTLHTDLDGNGSIDASVTWAGKSQADLPTPLQFDGLLWFT
ncbi:calcium-binding protein [Falsiroseomonas sp. HW251]|uniref:calcium-binding protein n=1 Tax=Falsiroseomonas sp. HW251 TaxID=3390998 RepID=UPI003D315FB7